MSERVKLADLSGPQRKMLRAAAAQRNVNYIWLGRGQAATARKLEALGLGTYISDGAARFVIGEKGYEVARVVRSLRPPASTEGSK